MVIDLHVRLDHQPHNAAKRVLLFPGCYPFRRTESSAVALELGVPTRWCFPCVYLTYPTNRSVREPRHSVTLLTIRLAGLTLARDQGIEPCEAGFGIQPGHLPVSPATNCVEPQRFELCSAVCPHVALHYVETVFGPVTSPPILSEAAWATYRRGGTFGTTQLESVSLSARPMLPHSVPLV